MAGVRVAWRNGNGVKEEKWGTTNRTYDNAS